MTAPFAAPRIARLGAADAPAYRALMLDGYERHPEAFTSSACERATLPLAWWERRLGATPGSADLVLGAWLGDGAAGELAGTVGLSFETRDKTRHKATLFGMYVPARHGGRGLGHALVSAALAHARRHPPTRLVQLTVSEGNDGARRLYERCGFAAFGIEPLAFRLGDGFGSKVHMWCDLAAWTSDASSDALSG
ncbi:MAG: GNAT family N-acetyltransferase [Burkholderiaceae bacterium]